MSIYRVNIIRFILLVVTQVFIFNFFGINWNAIPFVEIYIYPLFILLLPLRTPQNALILMSFFIGLVIDVFNNSPGVNAGAATLIGFLRPYVIYYLQPRGGYKVNISPTIVSITFRWFASYAAIMMFIYCFTISLLDIFQFKLFHYILLRTFLSGLVSYLIVMVTMIVFNPAE